MAERWERIEELFAAAVSRDPASRADFLAAACGEDRDLVREVESLLRADEAAGELFGRSPAGSTSPAPGRRVGAYRLLRPLGSGGMGAVYLAERADDPRAQRVAIKFLRQLSGGETTRLRFDRERRILARLDHPSIARFYDGGADEDGAPFIIMEHVEGLPIDRYCDHFRLTVKARLELFAQVCGAVDYAHRNLVVHRDLKPSNILVTGEGVPKLLDFGIAKLLEPEVDLEAPAVTASWMRLLTPDYASPEQVRGQAITTLSDIYSLGVVLYLLLSGRLPHRLPRRGLLDMERALAEEEPEPLSSAPFRLEPGVGEAVSAEEISAARGTDAPQLRRRLRGDLERIVAMAMAKEPERRYSSVQQLAEDLRRHLDGLPVLAREATWSYRTQRFLRRHRVAALLSAAFAILVLGFTLFAGLQSSRLARALQRAEHERDRAERVLGFVVDLFQVADPSRSRGATITAQEILDHGRERLEHDLTDLPDARAALMDTLGQVYGHLGLFEPAAPLLEEALALRRQATGAADAEVAVSLRHLAKVRYDGGQLELAEALVREALEIGMLQWGEQNPETATTMVLLGEILQDRGELEESETLHRRALKLRRSLLGSSHPDVARSLNDLGSLLFDKGEHEESEALLRESLALQRASTATDPLDTASTLSNLAQVRWSSNDNRETEELLREALAILRRVLGEEHPRVAQALNNLGAVLAAKDELAEAESLYREALARWRRTVGDHHPDVPQVLYNLGHLVCKRGECERAEPLFRESHELYQEILGEGHPRTADPLFGLAHVWMVRGEPQRAEPLIRRGLAIWNKALTPGHWWIARAEGDLGECLTALGRFEEAEPLLVESYPVIDEQLGPGRTTRRALLRLVELYQAWGREAEASKYRELLAQTQP